MAEVLLFHHAQGQTPGFLAFADELRAVGHTVHTPTSGRWKTSPPRGSSSRPVDGAELFLYSGDRHLFADSSLADYDEQAAAQLKERVLAFFKSVD